MLRHFILCVTFLATTLFFGAPKQALAAPAQGAQVSVIFVKIDGIEGKSTDAQHAGELEVVSFNWSEANREKGKPEPHDALILKAIDATTPKLADAVASGKTIAHIVVTVRAMVDGKPTDLVQYTFADAQITAVSHTVIQRAEEQIQFKYASVTIRYLVGG